MRISFCCYISNIVKRILLPLVLIFTAMSAFANANEFVYVSNADSGDISILELSSQTGELSFIENLPVGKKPMPMTIGPEGDILMVADVAKPYRLVSLAVNNQTGSLEKRNEHMYPFGFTFITPDLGGKYLLGASFGASNASTVSLTGNKLHSVWDTPQYAHAVLPDPTNKFVFVPCMGGDELVRLSFDADTGTLSNRHVAAKVNPGAGPRHIRFHPNGKFLYLNNQWEGSVISYAYNSQDGTLKQIQKLSILPENFPFEKASLADLRFSADGRFLFLAERQQSTLTTLSIHGETGLMRFVNTIPTEQEPRGLGVADSGDYILVAGQKSGFISSYKINDETGGVTHIDRHRVGDGPNWIEFVPKSSPETTRAK